MPNATPQPWVEPPPVAVPADLAAAVGGHPLVAAALSRRGLLSPQVALAYLDADRYTPASPLELPGVPEAVERIALAVSRGEPVGVWGDFDVDGVTSATVLSEALTAAGARMAWTHIPHRETEGHGVHLPTLQGIAKDVRLVITCDTGITAGDAAEWLAAEGIDLIICDHHLPGETLPPAVAVVWPHSLADDHPLAGLPGVGVALVLARACLEALGRGDADAGLDLAALGIVADVASLRGDVRYLLQRGLDALRNTRRVGLQALMETAGLAAAGLTEEHIGFTLAPRLNALGRLDHAQVAVDLFTTADRDRALAIAGQMERLNARRQLLCSQVTAGALEQLDRHPEFLAGSVLVLEHRDWPASVVGIVAARLVERYNMPAIVLQTPVGGPARGSARSVPGIDISEAIGAHRDMLSSFGGHPMAAGLSLPAEKVDEFRFALSRTVTEMASRVPAAPGLPIEAFLGWGEPSLELAHEIQRLSPFGADNPAPLFASRGLRVASATDLGRTGEHRRVSLTDENGVQRTVLWWHGADTPVPDGAIDLAYSLRTRTYRGATDVQLEWVDWRQSSAEAVTVISAPAALRVEDHRADGRPEESLRRLVMGRTGVQVWTEAATVGGVTAVTRRQLAPADELAVWTAPPGDREWSVALASARPRVVYLFGQDAGVDTLNGFTARLWGLVQHTLRAKGGWADYGEMASAAGHREETIRLGLMWLEAMGKVIIAAEDTGGLQLAAAPASRQPSADLAPLQRRLADLLAETAAYRRFWRRCDGSSLAPTDAAPPPRGPGA